MTGHRLGTAEVEDAMVMYMNLGLSGVPGVTGVPGFTGVPGGTAKKAPHIPSQKTSKNVVIQMQ